jgi:hypothetical protein
VAAFFVPPRTAAMAVMFQGGLALPAAFLLERRMAWGPMAKSNPGCSARMSTPGWPSPSRPAR